MLQTRRFRVMLLVTLLSLSPSAALSQSTLDPEHQLIKNRAVEAVIWGMPAVNYDLMLQEMLTKTPGKLNQVIFWGRPLDWHNQTLTPNPDTLYFMTFLNTKDVGPIVLEIPPADDNGSLNANIVNIWQQPLEDAGRLGVDKGKGLKLLMLPPDFKDNVPAGYEALQPQTFGSYALIRSNLTSHSPADIEKSLKYAKQMKVYPLSQAAHPPATVFTDVQIVDFDSTIRYDLQFFEGLNRIVQTEPWLDRDRLMIDPLKTLGIEKGKPFEPDADTKKELESAATEAHALLAAWYEVKLPPYFEGTHWTYPAPPEIIRAAAANFEEPDHFPLDARGMAYHYAYIGIKRLGQGQFYLINIKDKNGHDYDGGETYKLTVPPNAPVEQYWSLTAYDRETHALIKGVDRASRASNVADLKKNADGSVTLYLGPKLPAGYENNWIPTDSKRKFELMFRLYAPTKPLFDKTWKLPDVEVEEVK